MVSRCPVSIRAPFPRLTDRSKEVIPTNCCEPAPRMTTPVALRLIGVGLAALSLAFCGVQPSTSGTSGSSRSRLLANQGASGLTVGHPMAGLAVRGSRHSGPRRPAGAPVPPVADSESGADSSASAPTAQDPLGGAAGKLPLPADGDSGHSVPGGQRSDGSTGAGGDRVVIGDVALELNGNASLGYPWSKGGSESAGHEHEEIMISRAQYLLSWNRTTRDLSWAAWRLGARNLGSVKRQDHFTVDGDLQRFIGASGGTAAVDPQEYRGTCLDRGHQVPSGDRTASVEDNAATFSMSNIIPQTAWLNRVVWEHLEAHSRDLVRGSDATVFVFAGPVFGNDSGAERSIGPNHDIAVPTHNFKILVRGGAQPEVLASVLMPNVTSTGTDPIADHAQACDDQHHTAGPTAPAPLQVSRSDDWERFQTTVAEIERQSGLDFSFLVAGSGHP